MPNAAYNQDGKLYITNAKFKHEGTYTCHVTSVTGTISASAYLTIHGPPGEPGGVHARGGSTDVLYEGELELWWQNGPKRGFDVTYYIIEYRSYFDPRDFWTVWRDDIPYRQTAIELEKYKDWRGFVISGGLSPGSAYQFRVTSCNSQIGCSPHSSPPYVYYNMDSAAPIFPPDNVGGGGGAEGLLQIKWDPLPRSKWGSQSVSYIMYFRRQSDDEKNAQWEVVKTDNTYFNKIVGLDLYYLPYTVKVQAINPQGQGPNSTEVTVMSAERLPDTQPSFKSAGAVNATAGMVYWTPIPPTREKARGAIGGYQSPLQAKTPARQSFSHVVFLYRASP
ncbi:contactin [Elysia marginata]|uniref:Contactin n=1 Tax=Elysia marginata TaxID=1093978 RepID=A0AAV4HUN1_9GAST|nr:contactin [Elysia marginata]